MKKLEESKVKQSALYLRCLDGYDDISKKAFLSSLTNKIEILGNEYREKALDKKLHEFSKDNIIDNVNIKECFNDLYTKQMSTEKGSARNYYDYIKSRVDICVNCYHQKPTTLDHYLPKAKYPFFSVTPSNLIPCCRDCNTHKGQYDINKYEDQLINSYFDDDIFFDNIWLDAKVNIGEKNTPFIIYDVNPPKSWKNEDIIRVKNHFKRFKLNQLYSAQANVELFSKKNTFSRYVKSKDGLKKNLENEAKDLTEVVPNSWRATLYRCLSNSFWFCNIGVYNIKYEKIVDKPKDIELDD